MRVAILDDWFDTLRTLPSFEKLIGHDVTVFPDHVRDTEALARVPSTRGIVTGTHLAPMRPGALPVNTSRAGLLQPGGPVELAWRGRRVRARAPARPR
jgi:hypothetical protein